MLGASQRVAVQPEPLGMADAVRCGLASVETRHTLIVWGDQVALRPESLDFSMRLHQGSAQPAAVCPTLWRDHPYIHFERESDKVVRILQAREGDAMPERGESDSGVFLFRTDALRHYLPRLLESGECIGKKTGELNFLPIFPILDQVNHGPNHDRSRIGRSKFASRRRVPGAPIADAIDSAALYRAATARERMTTLAPSIPEPKTPHRSKLNVVLFSGGSGTQSITEAFLKHPQISLTILINAYDDGHSTGRLRRFIPGMLGPQMSAKTSTA